jgi:hypothetical protein
VVGKECPDCSPLVARGIYPDSLNVIKEAFVLPQLVAALDQVAVEVRTAVLQIGAPPTSAYAETQEETAPEKPAVEKPSPKSERPVVEKPSKQKKSITPLKRDDTKKKKKRVTMPPRAM